MLSTAAPPCFCCRAVPNPLCWWYFLVFLMYLSLGQQAGAAQTLTILPVTVPAGSVARVVGLARDTTGVLEVSTLAMGRYQLVDRKAPPTLTYGCVRDMLCVKGVAKGLNVDRLLTGTLEPTLEGLKLFVVLVDARRGNTLGSSEIQLTAKQLGAKVPGVVFTLIDGDPAPPPPPAPVTQTAPKPPAEVSPQKVVPPPTTPTQPAPPPSGPYVAEVDVDPEDLSQYRQTGGPRRIPFVATDLSVIRFVAYPLIGSGLAVGVRLQERWVVSGSFHQQTGRDPYEEDPFFILDGGLGVDRLLRQGVAQPWVGLQLQGIALAPTLNAACLTVGGGANFNLTPLFSIRTGLEAGVAYNSALPQTVYSLAALQPTGRLTLRLVFDLPVKER